MIVVLSPDFDTETRNMLVKIKEVVITNGVHLIYNKELDVQHVQSTKLSNSSLCMQAHARVSAVSHGAATTNTKFYTH